MKKLWRIVLIALFLMTACANRSTPTREPTQGLPTPIVVTTSMPDVSEVVMNFLGKWNGEDYSGMYAMLTTESQKSISELEFIKVYSDLATNLTLTELEYGILTTLIETSTASVGYQMNYKTALFGDLQRQMEMSLVPEGNTWKVNWHLGLVLPELGEGKKLALNITAPSRGEIYDNDGDVIVAVSESMALGVVRGLIDSKQEENLIVQLSQMTGIPKNMVVDKYRNADGDFYVPIGETTQADFYDAPIDLGKLTGLVANPYTARYYFDGGVAPQVIGYVLSISPEQYDEYRQNGYAGDEKVGAAGLEKWGESYLRGKPAADLYVVNEDGTFATRLGHNDPVPAATIYTTLDKDFQIQVQKALYGFTGAIVVLERDTGRVLAMASSPGYDPNVFQTNNYNSQYVLADLVNDPATPMWNRAAQSAYPLGSVFKLITAAAALESGLYKPTSTYECTSQFTELAGFVGNDWTFEKDLPPSGNLTLVEGIMRSCNPWFYHLGLELFRQKGATYLADMAREFGLGSATGIGAVAEEGGRITDPTTDGGAVQMGIGQGDMLVTPLQVASFVAAIGNGGTVYRPQIIEKITALDGTLLLEFKPEVRNQVPVSQENLDAIKEGMYLVVRSDRGTAVRTFRGVQAAIYAKTGTATTSVEDPHSWFAGFTDANNPDKPDIAIAVIAEYAGDGSAIAAPIFRRVIEAYYNGSPTRTYPWETLLYVTSTPTAEGTD